MLDLVRAGSARNWTPEEDRGPVALAGDWAYGLGRNLVGDLDALVAEPTGNVGDGDALGQGVGGVVAAQRVGDELRGQPDPGSGALEVFLVGAADDELVLAALEQVPVAGGAVIGGVLADRLAHVLGERDVAELPGLAEIQRAEEDGP